jgi:hypothetical protein
MHPFLRLTAGLSAAAVLTACGSTVPLSQQVTGADGLSSVPSAASDGGVAPAANGGATPGGSSSDVLDGNPGTTGAAVTVPTAGPSLPGTNDLSGVVGSTKPIYVGISYVKDAAAAAQAFGFQGATLGDMKLYAQILVDDLNKHGGLKGRKVIPVYFGYDANPGQPSWAQQDAQACAAYTQDTHIEIGLITWSGPGVYECLKKKNIPMLMSGPTGGLSSKTLAQYPNLLWLGGFNMDRRAREQVAVLLRQKYFTKWDAANGGPGALPVKIGIITYDFGDYSTSVNQQMVPAIVAAGVPKPDVVAVAPHDTYDNISKMQAQISSAVLTFKASGVSHVIIWDDNGVSTLLFMQQADSQDFHPRYGINSGNNLRVVTKIVSKQQLAGAIGMGWVPRTDIDEADGPTSKYANSARKSCYALMKEKEATGSGFNETSAMMYCATFYGLRDRWSAMPQPSAAGLRASFEAFGSAFVDPEVPATWMSPTQHDGLGGIYDYAYDIGCGCMKYTSGVQPLRRG